MTKAEQKIMALNAYQEAEVSGDWSNAAKLLKQAFVPAPRNPKVRKFKKGKCIYPYPLALAKFADGHTIRMNFWSESGLVLDWQRAKGICESVYRNNTGNEPRIVKLVELNSGEVCNA